MADELVRTISRPASVSTLGRHAASSLGATRAGSGASVAVRNGILLVSHYQDRRDEGRSVREAILEGSLDRL